MIEKTFTLLNTAFINLRYETLLVVRIFHYCQVVGCFVLHSVLELWFFWNDWYGAQAFAVLVLLTLLIDRNRLWKLWFFLHCLNSHTVVDFLSIEDLVGEVAVVWEVIQYSLIHLILIVHGYYVRDIAISYFRFAEQEAFRVQLLVCFYASGF